MIAYILNYLSVLFYAKIFNRRSFCILASVQMFLILALRADTLGVDLQTYAAAFEYISHLDFVNVLSRVRFLKDAVLPYPYSLESGWMLLNWLISCAGFHFRTLLVLCAAINMYAFGKLVYRYSDIPWMSYCICLSLNVYTYMFGILRQSLAMSIVLLAVMAFEKKEKKAFLLLVIAFTIHRTAIIALLFFYIIKRHSTNKQLFKWAIFGWIPFLFLAPHIYESVITKVMTLLGKGYRGTQLQFNNLMVLLILIGILVLFLYSFENIKNPMECLSIWSVTGAIYWETFGMMNENLARSVQYFIVFVSLAIPQVLSNYVNAKVIFLGKMAIGIMLFIYMMVSLQGSAILPYHTVFYY